MKTPVSFIIVRFSRGETLDINQLVRDAVENLSIKGKKIILDVDLLFHDAEYTQEEYADSMEWGHSAYQDALDMALLAGVKRLGLFHLNSERTDAKMDEIVGHCRRMIAERKSELECFGVGADMSFEV